MANFLKRVMLISCQKRTGASLNFLRKLNVESPCSAIGSSLIPQLLQVENSWIYQRNEKIRMPINQKHHIELPRNIIFPISIDDPLPCDKIIDEPPLEENTPMEATRMIIIRKQKMKNHKLKKLRKRLKFERAKIRQRRELKKEKEFQAGLIQQCKMAEEFSAEEYVQSRIQKYEEALAYIPKETNTFIK